jgi:hypothetical protein
MSWRGLEENDEATVFVQWIDSDPLDSTSFSLVMFQQALSRVIFNKNKK